MYSTLCFGGDEKVYAVDIKSIEFKRMKEFSNCLLEKRYLSMFDYECPFSLTDEFDEWFEWHRRIHFCNERSGKATVNMLGSAEAVRTRFVLPQCAIDAT